MGNQHGRRHPDQSLNTPPRSGSLGGAPFDVESPHNGPRLRQTPNKAPHPSHNNRISDLQIAGKNKHKMDNSKLLFKYSLHLDNDPSDREYVVNCPTCSRELFDNGLSQTLKCPGCRTEFDSQSRRMQEQVDRRFKQKKRKTTVTKHQDRFSLETSKVRSNTLYGPHAECLELESTKHNPFLNYKMSLQKSKPSLDSRVSQHKMSSSEDGGESLENLNIMDQDQETKEIVPAPLKRHFVQAPLEIDDDNLLDEEEDDDQEQVSFGEENKSDYSGDCSEDQNSEDETDSEASEESKESHQQRVAQYWSYFRKFQSNDPPHKEIVHLQLFCNKQTLIQDFMDKKDEPRSQLIIEKLLVPFFQIKSRVVSKGLFFKIGDLEFYVANCVPEVGGKVTSRTVLHPPVVTNFDKHIETLRLITTRRLHEHKSFVLKNTLLPYFKENQKLVYNNGSFKIKEGEFYVRYCRPQFGVVDEHTEVRLEASTLKEVVSVNILPIWEDEAHFKQIDRQGHSLYDGGYRQMLMLDFIVPYFLDAGQRKYVERGDTYRIGEINFYINGCNPKSGVIGKQSHLELEKGITKTTFHRKIVMADQRIAERLQCRQDIMPVQEIDMTHLMEMAEGQSDHNLQRLMRAAQRMQSREEDGGAPGRGIRSSPAFNLPPRAMMRFQGRGVRGGGNSPHINRHGLEISNRLDHIAHMISQIRGNLMGQQAQAVTGMPAGRVNQFPTRVTDKRYIQRQREDFFKKKESGIRMEYEDMDENPNLTCMICLMQYEEGDECRTLPCSKTGLTLVHYFHQRCIDNWLERGTTCPICKLNLMDELEGGAHD